MIFHKASEERKWKLFCGLRSPGLSVKRIRSTPRCIVFLYLALEKNRHRNGRTKEDFQFCLNRLVKRGLVVLTEGCTREEAVYSIISRSVMAPMAFSRTERMKHFMEALSMGKGLKFSLRAFKKPLLTEEEYQLLSYLQREGDVSYHLKCLKEKAKSRESHLEDSLQEQIQREFISRVAQLYHKKQLVIDNIRREDCLEANGTSVLAQAV